MAVRGSVLAALLLTAAPALAQTPNLAFKPADPGCYDFDTGALRGRLKMDGKFQGLYPLVDAASGMELVNPPGVFSYYRVFSGSKRFGNAARDWPTTSRVLADGAVEVRWAPAPEHPVEIVGVYRWQKPDVLDLATTVTPQQDLPQFELFVSSYFTKTFRASVYVKREGDAPAQPGFAPVDRTPQSTGGYVMFPRDAAAQAMIQDGRWKVPPNAVDWAIERWLAAPLVIRRDDARGLTAAMMARPEDCFAVSTPWNAASPEAGGYRSVYLSLFGRDIKAGQSAEARCRLVIAKDLSDEQVLARYREFLQ